MRAMAVKFLAYLASLFLLLIVNHGAEGERLTREQLDLEKQFKLFQKPSVKTITIKYGDIYDCVDFYKQPAFDHPLLKNHTFHPKMIPSFSLGMESASSQEKEVHNNMKLINEGCPTGTVLIKRVSKDDFIKMKQFTDEYASRTKSNGLHPTPGNHFAVVQTKSDPSTKSYNGVKVKITAYGLQVGPSQFSSGVVIIKNGDDTIQSGWTINPTINKDNRTRTFQYFNAGQTHCFNMLCPGFVNVNKKSPIDDEVGPLSKRGGPLYGLTIHIYKDANDGNWWLAFGEERRIQGFWPRQLFTGLATSATYIAVGGEVYGPPDQPLPPMGNGYYAINIPRLSAFCNEFTILDSNSKPDDNPRETEQYCDDWHYGVSDYGMYPKLGRTIFFGGLGAHSFMCAQGTLKKAIPIA